jgi:uncharacterized protein
MAVQLRVAGGIVGALGVVAGVAAWNQAPGWAAAALLHPPRIRLDRGFLENDVRRQEFTLRGEGVALMGWRFSAQSKSRPRPRGTVVYLHGVADNRASSRGPAERLTALGFDVIAYDSRAHGDSEGQFCTYGYYEKQDLQRVIDAIDRRPIVVIGTSLGAAVALQAAAEDARIDAVVAAESFSDLRTVATERAPRFLPSVLVRRAFAEAEARGRFDVDEVSPVRAAARINVPVMIVHGAVDRETPPEHSRRIYDALTGRRTLVMVDGAGHNQSLGAATWRRIERWLDEVVMEGNR